MKYRYHFSALVLVCLALGMMLLPACQTQHTHSYKEINRIDATCTKNGQVDYKCPDCGDSYSEIISSKGHLWNEVDRTDLIDADATYQCEKCSEVVAVELQLTTMNQFIKNIEETYPSILNNFDFSRDKTWADNLSCYTQYIPSKALNQLGVDVHIDKKGRIIGLVEVFTARQDQMSAKTMEYLVEGVHQFASCITNGYGKKIAMSSSDLVKKVFESDDYSKGSDGSSRFYFDGFLLECSVKANSTVASLFYDIKNQVSPKDLLNKGIYKVIQTGSDNSQEAEMVDSLDASQNPEVQIEPSSATEQTQQAEESQANIPSAFSGEESSATSSNEHKQESSLSTESSSDKPTTIEESQANNPSTFSGEESSATSSNEHKQESSLSTESSSDKPTAIETPQHIHSDACRTYIVDVPYRAAVYEDVKVIDSPHQDAVYGDKPVQYTDYKYKVNFYSHSISTLQFASTQDFQGWIASSGATVDSGYGLEGAVVINGSNVRWWAQKTDSYSAVRYEYGLITPEQPEVSHVEKVLVSPEVQEQGHWEYTCGY